MSLVRAAVLLSVLSATAGQDLFLSSNARPAKPNIVWFLSDDQDQMLGGSFPPINGATPMPKTKKLMQDEGLLGTNWYIHTPICSPSRSELLTGRYFHNIKTTGGHGAWQMHVNYTHVVEDNFAKILMDEAGYTTGMFGKYVNDMNPDYTASWDAWLANDGGDYIAPTFQTKNIDGFPNGEVKFSNDPSNYTTAVVGNMSIAWIRKVAKQGKPFFAYIAPKAAHEPFNPAVWYSDYWDPSWPEHEMRGENWNCSFKSRKNHHGNIATQPMITSDASELITGVFKNRWRTLMSVDDLISDVIGLVGELGLLDSTYFFFMSDHGFQLGQFNIPIDKRHVYEWNTKIHLLARGPGIKPGSQMSMPGTQVDIAPTLLGLAGVRAPPTMDGHSIVPFLIDGEQESSELLDSTRRHLVDLGDLHAYSATWRKEVFIEYYYNDYNIKCTEACAAGVVHRRSDEYSDYPNSDSYCVELATNTGCWCDGGHPGVCWFSEFMRCNGRPGRKPTCYKTEDKTNNYIALRELTESSNTIYAEFQTGDMTDANIQFDKVDFVEYYDLSNDIWQMQNIASTLTDAARWSLHDRLHRWYNCAGSSCP